MGYSRRNQSIEFDIENPIDKSTFVDINSSIDIDCIGQSLIIDITDLFWLIISIIIGCISLH